MQNHLAQVAITYTLLLPRVTVHCSLLTFMISCGWISRKYGSVILSPRFHPHVLTAGSLVEGFPPLLPNNILCFPWSKLKIISNEILITKNPSSLVHFHRYQYRWAAGCSKHCVNELTPTLCSSNTSIPSHQSSLIPSWGIQPSLGVPSECARTQCGPSNATSTHGPGQTICTRNTHISPWRCCTKDREIWHMTVKFIESRHS